LIFDLHGLLRLVLFFLAILVGSVFILVFTSRNLAQNLRFQVLVRFLISFEV